MNRQINAAQVRLVASDGSQVGVVGLRDALAAAEEEGLDLVEVAPTAVPPVCRIADYGKMQYEDSVKAREARKHQVKVLVKEIKLRPKIDPHDYATKRKHVERFLGEGDRVKVTIMFRGREQSRPELGLRLLQQLSEDVAALGEVVNQPKLEGRNMTMVVSPKKGK